MMGDAAIWLRWALYTDLAIGFGLPLTAQLLGGAALGARWRWVMAGACLVGVGLSMLGYAATLARMAGTGLDAIPPGLAAMMLTHSALGISLLVRCAALVAGAALALRRTARAAVACTALAVASLAWGGHAAASQGAAGLVRLGVDIAHLLAGLTWVGALALFAAKLWRIDAGHSATTQQLAHQLGRFAGVGSVLVGGLVISGVAHGLYLAPPAQIMAVARAPYGQLMALKLGLFAGMLALAMHNRFALVPALAQASTPHTRHRALAALRRSISLEAALALGVLWCVAVAGTLDPMGAN